MTVVDQTIRFKKSDVEGYKSGLDDKQKSIWLSVANGVLADCVAAGGKNGSCEGKAIRVANSKFKSFNPVLTATFTDKFRNFFREAKQKFEEGDTIGDPPEIPEMITPDQRARLENAVKECVEAGGDPDKCMSNAIAKLKTTGFEDAPMLDKIKKCMEGGKTEAECIEKMKKKFQYTKVTPPDPVDGHQHTAAYDENGDGGTDEAEDAGISHSHAIFGFRVQPFYGYDPVSGQYVSVHPGSLAFAELGEVEMEIFRVGTHNGDEYSEADLAEIASNFHTLKGELRPKLKITHKESQKTLAGLASYGDIVDVYMKEGADGLNHLFARVANVPKEVLAFIKERRFPERSIELYPSFKLGTKDDSPVYKNVLKAVALLGHEMPAVSGMAPIMLEECLECQGTICCLENCFVLDSKNFKDKKVEAPKEVSLAFEFEKTAKSLKNWR